MPDLRLPLDDGLAWHKIERACVYPKPAQALRSRTAYAAAHVVPSEDPALDAGIDWESTLAYRRYLWSYGLGVAEAMDTAQRGMGLPWNAARELIRRSLLDARACGGLIACGAATDQLPEGPAALDEIVNAYEEQCEWIERHGGRVILMASRSLAASASSLEDYHAVYSRVLSQLRQPAILHWLGEMFDPKLGGYWGSRDLDQAIEAFLALIRDHSSRIDGIKISLLDANREIDLRRRLPSGVRTYTGDDFNYPELIAGDGMSHSDALLGIFDAIAPAASAAIQALDRGNPTEFRQVLDATLPLSRHIFESPTYHYKTGIVFLAWLNGHQKNFRMVGGFEKARSLSHLAKLLILAERAGVLTDPDLACARTQSLLSRSGIVATAP